MRSDSTDAYWRRRAIALGSVLSLVGLVAWACAGGDEQAAERQSVRNAAALSTPTAPTLPTVPPTATATVTVTARTTVRPVGPKRGDACEPRDMVVGLAATKTTYAGKDLPRFLLTVVNTGRRACTFGVGPKELEIRITSGPDRIWTTAKCVRGSGSSILLRRGVPYIKTIVWDRKRSSTACPGVRPAARPGSYVATVKAGKVGVKKQVFRLR